MAEDRIIVDVDDTAIDIAIAKLKQAVTLSSTMGTPNIDELTNKLSTFGDFWTQIDREIAATQARGDWSISDLPGINREMRIIIGQIPEMRDAMRHYFAIKRLLGPITLEKGIVMVDQAQLMLGIIATLIVYINWLESWRRKMDQNLRDYETFIKDARRLNYEQWKVERDYWLSPFRSSPG